MHGEIGISRVGSVLLLLLLDTHWVLLMASIIDPSNVVLHENVLVEFHMRMTPRFLACQLRFFFSSRVD